MSFELRLDGTMSKKLLARRKMLQRCIGGALAVCTATSVKAQDKGAIPRGKPVTRDELIARQSLDRDFAPHVIELEPLEETDSIPVVTALASDPSGSYLAIAGDDHAVRIYSNELKRVIITAKAHTDWIHALQFGAKDELDSNAATGSSFAVPKLYSAGDDGQVICWQQGQPPLALERFDFPIRSLSFSTNRSLLAVGGFDERIILFDTQTRKNRKTLKCHCGDQRTVRFSPDGSRVLCGGRDGEVNVWDSDSGKLLTSYTAHTGRIFTASFSTDGNRVTSVGEDRRLVQYDMAGQRILPSSLELPNKLMAMSLINDSIVAIAGADNSIQLYDFQNEKLVANLIAHEGTVAVLCPLGKMLASGSFDTTVRIWDLEQFDARRRQPVGLTPIQVDKKLRIR